MARIKALLVSVRARLAGRVSRPRASTLVEAVGLASLAYAAFLHGDVTGYAVSGVLLMLYANLSMTGGDK